MGKKSFLFTAVFIYIYINSIIYLFSIFSFYLFTDIFPCNIFYILFYMPCISFWHIYLLSLLFTFLCPTFTFMPTFIPTFMSRYANEVGCLTRRHPLAHWLVEITRVLQCVSITANFALLSSTLNGCEILPDRAKAGRIHGGRRNTVGET